MCGIAGLFIKDSKLEPQLGELLSNMTSTLCSRGPDSAGFAIYGSGIPGKTKLTITGPSSRYDIENAGNRLVDAMDKAVSMTMCHSRGLACQEYP
jgi:methylamine---glutamate N-methyltransferase subunit A